MTTDRPLRRDRTSQRWKSSPPGGNWVLAHALESLLSLDHARAGNLCSQSGKKRRECLARCLLFLFQAAHEAVDGLQRVVCLLVWSSKRHSKMAESVLLYNEVVPAPQMVLQGS